MMIQAILLLTLPLKESTARKLAPIPIESLIKDAEIILYVTPTKDHRKPAVREVIWSSIGRLNEPIQLDPTPLSHPEGTPNEGGLDEVYTDSIVFLHRVPKSPTSPWNMAGANFPIVLHSNKVECTQTRVPSYNSPMALLLHGSMVPVYFPLPFKRKHRSYVTYPELKTAILGVCQHALKRS
jgi:hypothetical protein